MQDADRRIDDAGREHAGGETPRTSGAPARAVNWRGYVRDHLAPLGLTAARELDVAEEIGAQLEATYDAARRRGASHEEAIDRAEAEVQDWPALGETLGRLERITPLPAVAGDHRGGLMSGLTRDVVYAWRALARAPGLVAATIVSLALGIGATTIVYSFVDGILLRPLPMVQPDRVVLARAMFASGEEYSLSWPDFLDLQTRAQSFDSLASWRGITANLTGLGEPRRILVRQTTWNMLRVLGVQPILGRDLAPEDDVFGNERVCLVSYRFWVDELGSDANVIGRTLTLDDRPATIVGVMPRGFAVAREEAAYLPFGNFIVPKGPHLFRGNHNGLVAIGRLKPDATIDTARAEVKLIAEQLSREYPATNSGVSGTVTPLLDVLVRDARPMLTILIGAVAAMLLIACVNVANLLLVRGAGRAQEIEVRLALGASRARLARQLLVESVLLALGGGIAGIAAAFAGFGAFVSLLPADLPRIHQVALDLRVLGVALAVTVGTGLLFGMLPALQAVSRDATVLLRGERVASRGSAGMAARRALVMSEVALTLVLLAAGGLMARTMGNLLDIEPGFAPDRVLTASLSLPNTRYQAGGIAPFYARMEERLRAVPGVENAAFTNSLPVQASNWNSVFVVDDRPVPARDALPSAAWTPVTEAYFDTMGIRLVRGRLFGAADTAAAPAVGVVNESFARRFWPDGSAIGRRVKQGFPESKTPWIEIVGVVNDVKTQAIDQPVDMQAYLPMTQRPAPFGSVVVRSSGLDPRSLALSMTAAIHELDPNLPVFDIRTFDEVIGRGVARQRLVMTLLLGFSVLALIMAGVGVFGVTAYAVAERRHEIGIRLALGASRAAVARLVLRQELGACLAGVVAGIAAAVALSSLLESLLYGVSPRDPLTLTMAVLVIVAVATVACLLPARVATRIDPVQAIRE